MIRTLLIDDEKHIRTVCKAYLQERNDVMLLGECDNIKDGEVLIKTTNPDLVLLDIQLGDGTGFDLLAKFQKPSFKVIFITAFEQFALKALKAGALDYLQKPLDEDEFNEALDKVTAQHLLAVPQYESAIEHYHKKPARISVRTHQGIYIIWFEELLYCQSDGPYTTFYLADNSKVLSSKALKEYEAILPEQDFVRIHQSYIVNINQLARVTNQNTILLKNRTEELPLATRKREEVLNLLR